MKTVPVLLAAALFLPSPSAAIQAQPVARTIDCAQAHAAPWLLCWRHDQPVSEATMNHPCIEVYLGASAALTIANHADPHTAPRRRDIALSEFDVGGFALAANRVGSVILKTLALWHRSEFERLVAFKAVNQDLPHEMEVMSMLIARSMATRTRAYVGTIERLLTDGEHDSTDCRKFLREILPTLKPVLSRFPD